MPYIGKTPSQATRARYYLTASGGETSISGSMTVGGTLTFTDGNFVDVSVNGVALVAGTDYNTNTANTIAGLSALTASDQVEIIVYDTFSVFSGDVDSDFSVGGNLSVTGTATLTGNADFNGDLDVDGTTNLDVVDIDGAVDMASTLQVDGAITSSAGATITTADNTTQLTLISTDADNDIGPQLDLRRDSGSPADSDVLGRVRWLTDDDAGNMVESAILQSNLEDASQGTVDTQLQITTSVASTMRNRMKITSSEVSFNEDSIDSDFRVESNANANCLFVDAGNDKIGIRTGTPQFGLSFSQGTSDSSRLGWHDSSNNKRASIICSSASDSLSFHTGTSDAERMRIDSSGNVMMNTTSIGGTSILSLGSSNYMVATHNDGGTSGFFGQIRFRNNANNADVGTINRVNDASVQYNTTSDARLKENVADMTGAIARVKQLSPKRYSWVNEELDAADQDGFLAHEAQAVVPIAVSGTKDEVEVWQEGEDLPDGVSVGDNKLDSDGNTIPVFMQMDYSKLVPLLTGALQEAIAEIETLKTKVAALEAE